MRRNVRNITLVGFAALVLGGVAVASSGRFDSADDTAASSAGGAAADFAAPATTIPAFSNAGGCQSCASGAGRERATIAPARTGAATRGRRSDECLASGGRE